MCVPSLRNWFVRCSLYKCNQSLFYIEVIGSTVKQVIKSLMQVLETENIPVDARSNGQKIGPFYGNITFTCTHLNL